MRKINYHKCFYQGGVNAHDVCTHPHYCIFNSNRIQLESNIVKLENKLQNLLITLNHISIGGYYTPTPYETIKKRIKIIEIDLKELRLLEQNIKQKKVKGYGFIQL